MENQGQSNELSSGTVGDVLDLTLRLGSALYENEIRKMQNVSQANSFDSLSNKNVLQIGNEMNSNGFVQRGWSSPDAEAWRNFVPPYEIVESSVPPRIQTHSRYGLDLVSGPKKPMKKCKDCRNDKTPLWRKGPEGPQTLCNACGIRYARKKRAGAE